MSLATTSSSPLPAAAPAGPPPWPPEGYELASVTVGDRVVRYLAAGEGEPLVTVHGGGGLRREMGEAHAALTQGHRVLAVELPGWGDSPADGIGSLSDLADLVADFATALGLSRFDLMGTSVGGAVALWTAIRHPERVRALVLEAPAAFREGAPGPGDVPPFAPDGTPIPRPDPEHVAYLERISGPRTDPELVAAMPGCTVPALVLLGTRDRLFPPRFASDYARLPVSRVALVYAAGHNIKGDRPDAFLSIVTDFLTRGPTFAISDKSTLIHR